MKIVQFDIRDINGNGQEFVIRVINEAKKSGFVMPIPGWLTDQAPTGDDIFEEIAWLLQDLEQMSGLKYYLRVNRPIGVITDECPENAKKEKALRRKYRKAWDLDVA